MVAPVAGAAANATVADNITGLPTDAGSTEISGVVSILNWVGVALCHICLIMLAVGCCAATYFKLQHGHVPYAEEGAANLRQRFVPRGSVHIDADGNHGKAGSFEANATRKPSMPKEGMEGQHLTRGTSHHATMSRSQADAMSKRLGGAIKTSKQTSLAPETRQDSGDNTALAPETRQDSGDDSVS
jgi:hypothetical protein